MHRTIEDTTAYYQSQLELHRLELDQAKSKIRRVSVFRILSFLLALVGVYIASGINWLVVIVAAVIGFGVFIYFVIRHAKLFKQKQWHEVLVKINESELAVLAGDTSKIYGGEKFNSPEHPFTEDLDVFGRRSLFQLINKTATLGGQKRLASILKKPFKNTESLASRQAAIDELCRLTEWRQNFRATGELSNEVDNEVDEIQKWAKSDDVSFQNLFYKTMLILNPVLGIGVVLAIAFQLIGIGSFTLFLFLPFLLIGSKFSSINKEHNQLSKKSGLLKKYALLFRLVEDEKFNSPLLQDLQSRMTNDQQSANKSIRELSDIMGSFDYRLNLIVGILLNVFFLWDIRQCIRLEKWKSIYRNNLDMWFDKLAEIDELQAFSGFAFNRPDATYPLFSANHFEIKAINAKHPFIARTDSVGNVIDIPDWKCFQVITGANMAGKSTYLRTVGINLVLAMTGAPVLADEFIFKPVELFTSIKTTDSLQDGESYFYAELKRLKYIIDLLENDHKLFIILDEILRGTNSADKQKGSKALISQLVRLGSSGMIATHDLKLGELKKSFPKNIENKRFEVEIIDDELVFDYKLKEGISQNLNASFLMEKMGIVLDEDGKKNNLNDLV